MTGNDRSNDGIERVEGTFDYLSEERYWLPAASEERCQRIGRKRKMRLVKVVDTKKEPLPIICIFEDDPDE
ncbi:hypothetical protein C7B64_01635 [Merismopedia glauca CCAP 1448/3]|uniref:Uncharacterized protein n=1 Tax=Merismopedia glauca CCAP 1448/3 TaxID=1296344 RepID=A0A2T1C9J6_9CYAN|nr:hypothetical protein C7B64_01635 [Merismopedia glauca CCAP 1448/3]